MHHSWKTVRRFFAWIQSCIILTVIVFYAGTAHAEYLIGADDLLKIKVYGYDDLTSEARVSANGNITFPMLGEVNVGGLSIFAVENKLSQMLKRGGFIRDAKVSVSVTEYKSQQIPVLGQVNKPGLYSLESNNTLVNFIALAGGISQLGDDRAIVTRNIDGKDVKIDIDFRVALELPGRGKSFQIEKGDVIFIPKAPMFYIHGEVQRPGAYRLEPNITVSHALALGGGLTTKGSLRGIVIERREQDGAIKEIDAELTDTVLKDDVLVFDERLF